MAWIKTMVAVSVAIVVVAGCSSSKNKAPGRATSPPASHVTAAAASTPESSTAASSTSASAAGLSGTWDGHYSGSYGGTFTLNWTRTGSELSGTIVLSSPGGTLPIHGTVSNGKINFGTVGTTVITYTGSVSGSSMSGDYQVAGGAGGTGTWTASKM